MFAKKILVTGGAGFIASNFIIQFMKKHSDVAIVNYDLLTYAADLDNVSEVANDPRYQFIKGDISDAVAVKKLFDEHDFDAVMHFAAESHVDNSIASPLQFITTNVLGTQVLLQAAKDSWSAKGANYKDNKKFVHVSTDEVYGSLGATGYFTEETPLAPNSPYSASKAGSDLLVRAYFETYGFPGIITRCSNNYGPRQHCEKLIPLMISNAMCDKPLPVYGDGLNVRDWLHVNDHCAALERVLADGKIGEVYNIGGNNEWKNIDIVKLILKELGKPESLISYVTDRLGHDRRYAIDAAKIKRDLGWEPSVKFADGIKETVGWYQEKVK